mgnify:CR=1 FL=1
MLTLFVHVKYVDVIYAREIFWRYLCTWTILTLFMHVKCFDVICVREIFWRYLCTWNILALFVHVNYFDVICATGDHDYIYAKNRAVIVAFQ